MRLTLLRANQKPTRGLGAELPPLRELHPHRHLHLQATLPMEMVQSTLKYTTIKQLPRRPRITICALYLIALGLITAAGWIAADNTSIYLLLLCWAAEIWLLTHLIRRT